MKRAFLEFWDGFQAACYFGFTVALPVSILVIIFLLSLWLQHHMPILHP